MGSEGEDGIIPDQNASAARKKAVSGESPEATGDPPGSKHAKYTTSNPMSRYLLSQFFRTIDETVSSLGVRSLLDVGCGEGMVLRHLQPHLEGVTCAAIDLDPVEVADAKRNLPCCNVQVGSAYAIPFRTGSFELVTCSEVLEHLEVPSQALAELRRVSSKYVLATVPREPLWRLLNLARGAYLRRWGNTEGHCNHWSARSFEKFVAQELEPVARFHPIPWTVILARKP